MITPTKGVRPERSLLHLGGQILAELEEPTTVSGAWKALARRREREGQERADPTRRYPSFVRF